MKFLSVAITSLAALSSATVSAQEGAGTLRGTATATTSNTDFRSIAESSCMQIDDETKCNQSVDDSDVQCVWCKCSAVPSECLSVEQSKNAPKGVFECATPPDSPDTDTDTDAETKNEHAHVHVHADQVTSDATNPFHYSLRDGAVDPNLCDPNSKSLSGYMDISASQYDEEGDDKHLFYWFFEKRSESSSSSNGQNENETNANANTKLADSDIPIILWLTGGPGCSSTLALLFENGPCKVTPDGTGTTINPYSWTEAAHVLWLDQPAGVGFSYGKENDYNEEMISEDAYYFLQEFYKEHPEYSNNPLTIVGESYGGHYAPAVAHKVWTKNKAPEENMLTINLAGLAVGNGLTNPHEQYKWYPEMAIHNSHELPVVSQATYEQMTSAVPKCQALIDECNAGNSFINKFACQTAFIVCNTAETTPYQMTGLNPYDIRKKCEVMPLCYDFSYIEKFLNLESTRSALNVSEHSGKWASCNMGINLKFHSDWMHDFSPYVADLLNDGIHALIYAGDVDYICNYLGNRAWTLGLDWKGKDGFNAAEDHEWGTAGEEGGNYKGNAAGLAKTSGGFTFMQVYDAGHMVPTDQPKVALEMITNFISGGEF